MRSSVTNFYKMFLKSPSGQNEILFQFSFKMKMKETKTKTKISFNEFVDENFFRRKKQKQKNFLFYSLFSNYVGMMSTCVCVLYPQS